MEIWKLKCETSLPFQNTEVCSMAEHHPLVCFSCLFSLNIFVSDECNMHVMLKVNRRKCVYNHRNSLLQVTEDAEA